jgi:propionate CoA-transferase
MPSNNNRSPREARPRIPHVRGQSRVMPVEQALDLIRDGDRVFVSGVGYVQVPRFLTTALEARFLERGTPRGLQLVTQTMAGSAAGQFGRTGAGYGQDQFAHEGMITSYISSNLYPDWYPMLTGMILAEEVEAYLLPMGVMCHAVREAAGGRPGFLSKVGLWSYVDPRVEGPGVNAISTRELVRPIEIDGDEYLYYKAIPIDVALIRGSVADEEGNISLCDEPLKMSAKYAAMAAHNNGGVVIAQVKRVAKAGSLDPHLIDVPSILVDAVVIAEDQMQLEDIAEYIPALAGTYRQPVKTPEIPLDEEKVIGRRAALELFPGAVFNCGFRIPQQKLPQLSLEENFNDLVNFSMEHGVLGGENMGGILHWNPSAWLDSPQTFDFYDGGGLHLAFLSFGQIDAAGNINLTRMGDYISGPGGALDIGHAARTIVFCGTFRQGGLRVEAGGGRLSIVRDGLRTKFIPQVDQVTFSERERRRKGQQWIVITERAVFRKEPDAFLLTEIAPGIDLQRNVLDKADFPIAVAPDVKEMDPRIFMEEPLGIRDLLLRRLRAPAPVLAVP